MNNIETELDWRMKRLTPPEFKLENYAGTGELDAAGWLACLWHRFCGDALENGKIFTPEPINWAQPLDCTLPDEILSHEPDEITSVVFLDPDQIIDTTNTPDTYAYLMIDLDMSDSVLIEDFKAELKITRSRADVEARKGIVTEADFRNWQDARILQYLDVCRWQELNDVEATQNEIGVIIFPDDDSGNAGERIRRTVVKHIERATSRQVIISLLAQMKSGRKK